MQPTDETTKLISDASYVWRSTIHKVKPAKNPLPKTLQETLDSILQNPTMGYISNALTYSKIVYGIRERKNLMRLLKGGILRVMLVFESAPAECRDRVGVDRYHYRFERV